MRVEAETNIWHSKNPHVKVCVCTIFIKWQILILALKLQQHCTGFCNCCDLLFGSSKNRGQIWMHFVSDANTSKLGTAPPSGIWREWRLWREVLSKTEATRTTRLATTGVDRNPSEPPPPLPSRMTSEWSRVRERTSTLALFRSFISASSENYFRLSSHRGSNFVPGPDQSRNKPATWGVTTLAKKWHTGTLVNVGKQVLQ